MKRHEFPLAHGKTGDAIGNVRVIVRTPAVRKTAANMARRRGFNIPNTAF